MMICPKCLKVHASVVYDLYCRQCGAENVWDITPEGQVLVEKVRKRLEEERQDARN